MLFAMHMSLRRTPLALLMLILLVSCATRLPLQPKVAGWPGSEVYKMPQWTFMTETLESKDGRFRYWFAALIWRDIDTLPA